MDKQSNPYVPLKAVLEGIIDETPTIRTLRLVPEAPFEFLPGQFVQLCVPGFGEAPFTPSSSPHESDFLDLTVLRTGVLTNVIHQLKRGAVLGIRGPLGKGYPTGSLMGKDILVIGGGVGLAPLRSLLHHLFHIKADIGHVDIKYGARTPSELLFREDYRQWSAREGVTFQATVDQAVGYWDGPVGVVTMLLENIHVTLQRSLIFSCGPEIMFKFVTAKLLEMGCGPEQIYLSMNRRMNCGIGTCGRCNVGPYLLCKDGPDMNYDVIKDIPGVF